MRTRPIAAVTALAALLLPLAAQAYWRGDVWVEEAPQGGYYEPQPPPVVEPAPPEYSAAPPPVMYSAPPQAAAYGATCYAGVYVCNLPQAAPAGATCSCPGIGAPSFGTVR